jgi:hypothetical protein
MSIVAKKSDSSIKSFFSSKVAQGKKECEDVVVPALFPMFAKEKGKSSVSSSSSNRLCEATQENSSDGSNFSTEGKEDALSVSKTKKKVKDCTSLTNNVRLPNSQKIKTANDNSVVANKINSKMRHDTEVIEIVDISAGDSGAPKNTVAANKMFFLSKVSYLKVICMIWSLVLM